MEEFKVERKVRREKGKKRKKSREIKIAIKVITLLISLGVIALIIMCIKGFNNIEEEKYRENISTIEDEVSNYSNEIVKSKVQTNKKNILIVNKEHRVDPDYMPYDLTIPDIPSDKEVKVRAEVAEKLEQLFKKASDDGINLIAISGYRAYDYQEYLYNNSVKNNGEDYAEMYVAEAGYSEHQTGLALDLLCKEYMTLDEGFEKTDAFKWLQENMSDYGFILRYLKGKEEITGYNYEPWHIRYVGVDIAKDIESKGVTLEEYVLENN